MRRGSIGVHQLIDGEPVLQLAHPLLQRPNCRFQIHFGSPCGAPAVSALLEKSRRLCNTNCSNLRGGPAMQYNFVSGDDHMDLSYIPARLWVERVPARYREMAPHIEEHDGKRRWVSEGKPWDMGGYGTMDNPLLRGAIPRAGVKEEPLPGSFRPSTARYRLEDMDRDGIDA